MRLLKCSEWLGLLECSWFYFPSEYTTAFSILWFCLNVIELSLKLQFNRLHSLTSILSIKMRTFSGLWGGCERTPCTPPGYGPDYRHLLFLSSNPGILNRRGFTPVSTVLRKSVRKGDLQGLKSDKFPGGGGGSLPPNPLRSLCL